MLDPNLLEKEHDKPEKIIKEEKNTGQQYTFQLKFDENQNVEEEKDINCNKKVFVAQELTNDEG